MHNITHHPGPQRNGLGMDEAPLVQASGGCNRERVVRTARYRDHCLVRQGFNLHGYKLQLQLRLHWVGMSRPWFGMNLRNNQYSRQWWY